jgi:hypothetical protein
MAVGQTDFVCDDWNAFMKLLRYGPIGAEKPGLLDANGDVIELGISKLGKQRQQVVAFEREIHSAP